jgi:hypothetical protein
MKDGEHYIRRIEGIQWRGYVFPAQYHPQLEQPGHFLQPPLRIPHEYDVGSVVVVRL